MNPNYRSGARVYTFAGRSFLERVLLFVAGAGILILGFFFLTVALAAGAILAAVILVRAWWIMRKLRNARRDDVIEGEYRIVDRTAQRRPPRDR
jgi:hypothetical protein